jgi:hypothetical protein
MTDLYWFVLFACLTLGCIIFIFDKVHYKDKNNYKKLVPKPEDLLHKESQFSISVYPNKEEYVVSAFGKKFNGLTVLTAACKDVQCLEHAGHKILVEYYYEKVEPPSVAAFQEVLRKYERDMQVWCAENQGRPDLKKKPQSPYDYSKLTLRGC